MIYSSNSLLTLYLKTKQRGNHREDMIHENTLVFLDELTHFKSHTAVANDKVTVLCCTLIRQF